METTHTKRTIGYWLCTALLVAGLSFGGLSDLLRETEVTTMMRALGYPAYFPTIIGAWKLLAVLALLAPGLPRLKEWAYAGIFFDLTGAALSHAIVGEGASSMAMPLCFVPVLMGSWALRPESRVLSLSAPERSTTALAATGSSIVLAAVVSATATPPARDAILPREDVAQGVSASGAADVVAFWREAGPSMWFAKDPEFDRRFRERFLTLHERAARGELDAWMTTPEGSLALLVLLDQFPRNAFRGTPRMYATDAKARAAADTVIARGLDRGLETDLRVFIYLPFAHSESLADQERSVALTRALGEPHLSHAVGHHDIVERFGRFPHRNAILGRPMRPEEQAFLDAGGFSG